MAVEPTSYHMSWNRVQHMHFSYVIYYGESKQMKKQHSSSEPYHKARYQFTIHVDQYQQDKFRKYQTFDIRYMGHDNTSRKLRHGVYVMH